MTRAELPEQIETERLLLRVRTVADAEDIFDFASRPEVSYPAGFPPVKTLEDEIYYLEHILPERNQKDNLPAGYGICADFSVPPLPVTNGLQSTSDWSYSITFLISRQTKLWGRCYHNKSDYRFHFET